MYVFILFTFNVFLASIYWAAKYLTLYRVSTDLIFVQSCNIDGIISIL